MADALTLRVITPEKIVIDTTASAVTFPALDGGMGVLPRHAPMVAALDAGQLAFEADGERQEMFISGGFAEVRDNTVRVVTEASEPASDIDVERAASAAERARERLGAGKNQADGEPFDFLRAEAALRRALMRKLVADRSRRG
ncbi:MAG: F0F1 ATP synthase subunit epsilon [Planctomycetota bacterium]|nr:F0F1 ATP synthase subunit epsilon [Planctomycetota bacterium]